MNLDEIGELTRDLHYVGVMLDLEIDVQRMYLAFYEQHKEKYGTGKIRIRTNLYEQFMNARYDYIFCCINEVLESKLNYRRKQNGV